MRIYTYLRLKIDISNRFKENTQKAQAKRLYLFRSKKIESFQKDCNKKLLLKHYKLKLTILNKQVRKHCRRNIAKILTIRTTIVNLKQL